MKTCNSCESEKERSEFHKRNASSDGLASKCKACQRLYDSKRNKDPKRALARAEYAKTSRGRVAGNRAKKAWARRNPEKIAEINKAYRKENPVKSRCHDIVAYALRKEKVYREPCEICGHTKQVHAHHDDYAKPLEIRWLCPSHHRQWHAENGEAKNPE